MSIMEKEEHPRVLVAAYIGFTTGALFGCTMAFYILLYLFGLIK